MSEKAVYGWIYLIKNKINGKKYIGQTTMGFDKRYKNNIEKYCHNVHLKNSIKKYGIENFEIVKEFDVAYSLEELNQKEKEWIDHFGGQDSDLLYNLKSGGDNAIPSKELRKKLSEAQNKRYSRLSIEERKKLFGSHSKGKPLSNSHVKKVSLSKMGHEVKEETREKIRKTLLGHKRSEESIKKQILHRVKKVICINTNIVYDSIKQAGEDTNTDTSCIVKCCKGKIKSAGKDVKGNKLVWEYYFEDREEGLQCS